MQNVWIKNDLQTLNDLHHEVRVEEVFAVVEAYFKMDQIVDARSEVGVEMVVGMHEDFQKIIYHIHPSKIRFERAVQSTLHSNDMLV